VDDPDRWRQIENLYHAALARGEPERDTFISQACAGDESLEQEIRSLLTESAPDTFLEGAAVTFADRSPRSQLMAAALKSGATVSHFELFEKLGEGGMGVVFKARDKRLKRLVALKFIAFDAVTDPEYERRLLQEARTASSFRHPNIAQVYDVDQAPLTESDQPVTIFIVMEYVPGKTLSQMISEGPLNLQDVLRLALQAADALATAHRAGIIHRYLKPRNIMVDESGVVKVLDFGRAKVIDLVPEPDALTRTTQSTTGQGMIAGTAAYMSPEQVECKKLNSRSDIFSFGTVLKWCQAAGRFREHRICRSCRQFLARRPCRCRRSAQSFQLIWRAY
jgi:eukaryotic-like serine/threonine-protein kinase